MDIISVSTQIENRINRLATMREQIDGLAKARAMAIGEYDKQLGVVMFRLRTEEKVPVSVIEKGARAKCYEYKIDMELKDTLYKAHMKKMDIISAELNGYQSINRHLDNK